jgi:hypothetical protein
MPLTGIAPWSQRPLRSSRHHASRNPITITTMAMAAWRLGHGLVGMAIGISTGHSFESQDPNPAPLQRLASCLQISNRLTNYQYQYQYQYLDIKSGV